MKTIERRMTMELCRDRKHRYVVLQNGNYYDEFYADNDDESIQIFRTEYIN